MDGVARALDGSAGMRVVLQATSGAELLRQLDEVAVDVVLIEPWMRDGEGLDAISGVVTRFPGLPIIALSGVADPGHVQQAVALGVHAYVGKGTRANDLPSIVRHVIAGAMVLPATSAQSRSVLDLTPREIEVLGLAAEGLSNNEIGSRLYVTEQTVKFHLGNIYRKMGVANRTEAALASAAVVGVLDPVNDRVVQVLAGMPCLRVQDVALQQCPEALHGRVVPG
jgi:DNA-binding NarL/FixJ family response regulator